MGTVQACLCVCIILHAQLHTNMSSLELEGIPSSESPSLAALGRSPSSLVFRVWLLPQLDVMDTWPGPLSALGSFRTCP